MKETLRQKGIRLAQEGKMEKARGYFTSVLHEDLTDPSAWSNIGTTFLHEKEYSQALPFYEKAIGLDPYYDGAYLSAGMCLNGLGFHDDAIRLYHKGLLMMPDCADLWYNIAHTLMELGRIPEAVATFDHVLGMKPRDYGAVANRRDMLSQCSFKGRCTQYSVEEEQMVPSAGLVYSWNGIQFVTLALDDIDDAELETYDPDAVEIYSPQGEDEGGIE